MLFCIYCDDMMKSYLEQMDEAAAAAGISLAAACAKANIASTNLPRWRKGDSTPTTKTASRVFDAIRDLSEDAS